MVTYNVYSVDSTVPVTISADGHFFSNDTGTAGILFLASNNSVIAAFNKWERFMISQPTLPTSDVLSAAA